MTAHEFYTFGIQPHLKPNESGCLQWPWAKDEKGYGRVQDARDRRIKSVHRLVWEAFNGPPKGQILHTCDNKTCANIEHLYDGTHKDNVNDALTRRRYKEGSAHYLSLFTQEQVIEILYWAAGGQTASALARKFGGDRKTICAILEGRTWKSVHKLAL